METIQSYPVPKCRCYVNISYARAVSTGRGTLKGFLPCPVHEAECEVMLAEYCTPTGHPGLRYECKDIPSCLDRKGVRPRTTTR